MEELNRDKISEEIRYVWKCPKCGTFNEDSDDPAYEEEVFCGECMKDFKLVEKNKCIFT